MSSTLILSDPHLFSETLFEKMKLSTPVLMIWSCMSFATD